MGASANSPTPSSQSGFTLIEVLASVTILAAVLAVFTAVSLTALDAASNQNSDRELDASTAQFIGATFGRDVEGSSGITSTACGNAGTLLITFTSSTSPGRTVSYWTRPGDDGTELVRTQCANGSVTSTEVVATEIGVPPTVTCDGTACDPAARPRPREVTLRTGRRDDFAFRLTGSRRTMDSETAPPVLTARLFSLGGSTPLSIGGNGKVVVNGDAYVNSSAANAINLNGNNARLTVNGSLKVLQGGGCSGCNATKVTPFPPGSFPSALPDPLAHLPAPSESGLPAGACSAGRCKPGVYSSTLSLTSSTTFEPGIYVLRRGLSFSGGPNTVISGSGVLLFNGCGTGAPASCTNQQGSVSVSGQVRVDLTPPTSGTYAGILLFQSRSNSSTISISGGAQASSYQGVLYAPNGSVTLGTGGGGMSFGAVIGQNLSVSGNGSVTING